MRNGSDPIRFRGTFRWLSDAGALGLESSHQRINWTITSLAQADAAFELAGEMEKRMASWAVKSWRWRIFRLRTRMDRALKHGGRESEASRTELSRCSEELRALYHARNAEPQLRPLTP